MEVEDRPSSERLIMPIAMQPPGAAGEESKWSRRQDDHAHFTDEGPRLKLRELRCLTQSRTRIQAIDWGSFGSLDVYPGCVLGTHVIHESTVVQEFPPNWWQTQDLNADILLVSLHF